jgi:peptidoglycan hydrolase-like protein with peptidoglycan-binding domain
MKKVYKITEAQLKKIVSNVLNEDMKPVPAEGGGGSTKPSSTPMSKSDVEKLQTAISKTEFAPLLTKYTNVNNGIDGKFGKGTRAALAAVQAKNKITGETNTIGPLTKKALNFDTIVVKPTTPVAPKTSKDKASSLAYIVFNGKTLNWVENGRVVKQWNAWSGRTKWNAQSPDQREMADRLTKIEFMKVAQAGPTPEGNYTISSIQTRTNGNSLKLVGNKSWEQIYKMYDDEYDKIGDAHDFNNGSKQDQIAWGNYRLPITKKNGTETFGRGSFYLHGGGIAGSIGCIDLVDKIDDFVQYYKQYLSKTGAKGMDLLVDYSNKVSLDTNPKIPMARVSAPNNVGDKRSELQKGWDDQNSPENRGKLYGFQKPF